VLVPGIPSPVFSPWYRMGISAEAVIPAIIMWKLFFYSIFRFKDCE
jgi:hypothetical protein